jgi:hypothetical protein
MVSSIKIMTLIHLIVWKSLVDWDDSWEI